MWTSLSSGCIDVWLENNSKCPCCRADLLTTQIWKIIILLYQKKKEKESKNNEESKTN